MDKFFLRLLKSALGVLIAVTTIPGFAYAYAFPDDMVAQMHEQITASVERYRADYEAMKDTDPAEWRVAESHEFLNAALWVVFNGLACYYMETGNLPGTAEELQSTQYLPVWPLNPYKGWSPMEVLDPEEGFSAGDLILEICPPEFYSGIKHPRPASFELSIFGPDVQYGELGDAHPLKANSWASIPTGAVFMLGIHTQSASVTRKKFEERNKQGGE